MNNSVARAIDILNFVGKQEQHSTLSDIVQELRIPKSTASNIIHTLIEMDMLQIYDKKRMTFGLGYRTFEIGQCYIGKNGLWDIVQKELRQITKTLEISAAYLTHNGVGLSLVDMVPYSGSVYPNFALGAQWDYWNNPAGLVCLAAESDEALAARFGTTQEINAILEQVMPIRQNQYYADDSQDLATVNVPVYSPSRKCIGVLCIYELRSRLDAMRLGEICREGKLCAEKIAKQLGWLRHE